MRESVLDCLAHVVCDILIFHGGPGAESYCRELGMGISGLTDETHVHEKVRYLISIVEGDGAKWHSGISRREMILREEGS
jgi:hypothetical protein